MQNIKDKFYQCISFPLGFICLEVSSNMLQRVYFTSTPIEQSPNRLTVRCIEQLREYLTGARKIFDCPLHLSGTDFQLLVWKETTKIPYGQLITYKQMAGLIGHPGAYRAVANALASNKFPIFIPCHRVVSSTVLGGYTPGLEIKKFLLSVEGVTI